jgi:hypothetical protein
METYGGKGGVGTLVSGFTSMTPAPLICASMVTILP